MLTLSCVERAGIVQAVTTFLFERGFNIDEHQQFDDGLRQTLHLRTAFSRSSAYSPDKLEEEFRPIADRFGMKFRSTTRPNNASWSWCPSSGTASMT